MNGADGAERDPWQALIAPDLTDGEELWDGGTDRPFRAGEVVAVVGAVGGAGATMVANTLALAVAAGGGLVTLVDLDFVTGDLADAWAVPADRTLADLEGVIDEITPEQVRLVAHPHPSGVRLLLSPGADDGGFGWDERMITRVLEAAAADGAVVVDVGRGAAPRHRAAACAGADRLVIVSPPTVRGARSVARIAGGRRCDVVLNHRPGVAELGVRGFCRLSGADSVVELRRRDREAALLGEGRWPATRRRRLAEPIGALCLGGGG